MGILEYIEPEETIDDIGGLDSLKLWAEVRGKAFSVEAREFGLPMPRGIVLVGPPGCGKSLCAKAMSVILGVPLIKFDIGSVLAGLVGQSEQNMRNALHTIDAIGNCVVWIDEMEKAFAGAGGSGQHDSGVTQRVFGTFITWMQEKKSASFIVATVNRIEGLPPELLRKGRFDEIFYVGLPSEEEREEIFKIHLRALASKIYIPDKVNIKDLVRSSDKFSGAEIRETIVEAMYQAFYRREEAGDEKIKSEFEFYVQKAITDTTPLAVSEKKAIQGMMEWAEINAVNASVVKGKGKSKNKIRSLDIKKD